MLVRTATSRRSQDWIIILVLCLAGTVVSLQQTLIIPLLADLPGLLDTTPDDASWVITATLVSGAVATPIVTRLADMVGKRRMMCVVLGVTVVGASIGVLGDTLMLIIIARVLQGVGMSLIPVAIAIMRDELPARRLALGVGLVSTTLALGAGAGLPLAGVLLEAGSWKTTFLIPGAVGALMLLAVWFCVPESPIRSGGRFDYVGGVLLSAALALFLLSLTKASTWGITSASTVGTCAAAVVIFLVWVRHQLGARDPLVDVRSFGRPAILLVNLAAVLAGYAMYSNMLVTTVQLQSPLATGHGFGMSTFAVGVWMAPTAVVFGLTAPVAAALTNRFGPGVTLLGGLVIMMLSYALRGSIHGRSLTVLVTVSLCVSVGTSMAYTAMPAIIMASVPITETASANGVNTLLRSVGTSISSAAAGGVTQAFAVSLVGGFYASTTAVQVLVWTASAAAGVAALLVLPLAGRRGATADPAAGSATTS